MRFILLHELQHWKTRDSCLHLAANLVQHVHWFNPLVHTASKRNRRQSRGCHVQAMPCSVLNTRYPLSYGPHAIPQAVHLCLASSPGDERAIGLFQF
ncbi:hypothetical protein D3H35_17255 [Cohnella faecalis]|uniref:Peptidase M56 domain-containing protein n=1 Tax=Cohnella faecalis TaxID=2315694 RepID=A0A398CT05_9BACL|nr:hypothetical protein D3H35_17255 [Cohnella faecalis]